MYGIKRRLLLTACILAGLALSASAASAHHGQRGRVRHRAPAPSCPTAYPGRLSFVRANGRTFGTLSWKPGRRAPRHSRYRVLRNGAVVGETRAHSMRVNVSFGRLYRLRVRLILPDGRPLICHAPVLAFENAYRLPSPPGFPAASSGAKPTVTVSWQPARRGDGTVVGYRVLRDGLVYKQTRMLSMSIPLASNSSYRFSIVAVDSNERLSSPSAPVLLRTGHAPPSAPGSLRGAAAGSTSVQLSWQPSQAVWGRIAGYRILRNGVIVAQYSTTSVQLGNLRPDTTYTFAVVAVDSLGYVSGASSPVTVRTTAPLPPSAPGGLLGAAVNDTTVALSWQSSQPAQGRIVAYRVLRDGTAVGQFEATSVNITNLFPSTTYTFTVLAVDNFGEVSAGTSTVSVRTANPTPTRGHVYAFLLASTGRSFQDFQAHYQEVGTVSPTYYDCDPSANMTGGNVPLITRWAQARHVKVLPRFNCQRSAVLDSILNDPTLRQQWLTNIVNEVSANGYDGASLDFEAGYAKDRDAYSSFITDLAAQLHATGKTLMVAVSAKTADVPNHPRSTFFDYNALSAQADVLFVMCWGIHWATSAPGAQDDMTWVRQVVAYVSSLPRLNKYVLGMQLYAMDWANGGGIANPSASMEYQNVIDLAVSEGATPVYDPTVDAWTFSYTDAAGSSHSVWYTDATTEGDRITLAKQNGLGGIGVWRLGKEDQRLWANPEITGVW